MLHSHQIKIATDWLQTGIWLASDTKIGVNRTMLYQCNPTALYQSEASLKPVRSDSREQIYLKIIWCEWSITLTVLLDLKLCSVYNKVCSILNVLSNTTHSLYLLYLTQWYKTFYNHIPLAIFLFIQRVTLSTFCFSENLQIIEAILTLFPRRWLSSVWHITILHNMVSYMIWINITEV